MEHAPKTTNKQGNPPCIGLNELDPRSRARLAPGGRRHTPAFLAVQERARSFSGLPQGITIKAVAASAKRAAPLLGLNRSQLALVDLLVDHAQPQDFIDGSAGVVWCSNAWLALRGDWSEDYVKKLLRQLIERGILGAVDSPNGKRYGLRDAQGRIVLAYGIDLRPLASRYEEFKSLAAEVRRQHEERSALARRLTIAARAVCQLAETAIEHDAMGADWFAESEVATLARRHGARLRQCEPLRAVVIQVETRLAALKAILLPALDVARQHSMSCEPVNSPPTGVSPALHKTATDISLAQRTKCEAFGGGGGHGGAGWPTDGASCEESILTDLDVHRVNEAFVAKACPDVCGDLVGEATWPWLHERARNEGRVLGVTVQCWTEAQRVMGPFGATAAMLLVVQKRRMGLVEKPGAYFRALTKRAASGALDLGRSFHGLRDKAACGADARRTGDSLMIAADRLAAGLADRMRYVD